MKTQSRLIGDSLSGIDYQIEYFKIQQYAKYPFLIEVQVYKLLCKTCIRPLKKAILSCLQQYIYVYSELLAPEIVPAYCFAIAHHTIRNMFLKNLIAIQIPLHAKYVLWFVEWSTCAAIDNLRPTLKKSYWFMVCICYELRFVYELHKIGDI